MNANQAAYDAGLLAQDMVRGYAVHITAIRIAPPLDHKAFIQLIADRLTDSVPRKDGTNWSFDTQDALADLAKKTIAEELPRVWLAGSLLALGDRLERNAYFDHAPELELVYHLRNGIAHGNRFEIHNRKRAGEVSRSQKRCVVQAHNFRDHTRAQWTAGPVRLHGGRAMCSTFCHLSAAT